jgi:hypothetical protein
MDKTEQHFGDQNVPGLNNRYCTALAREGAWPFS